MRPEDDEPRGKVDAVSLLYIFGGIPVIVLYLVCCSRSRAPATHPRSAVAGARAGNRSRCFRVRPSDRSIVKSPVISVA
jgi:hypothetical protein